MHQDKSHCWSIYLCHSCMFKRYMTPERSISAILTSLWFYFFMYLHQFYWNIPAWNIIKTMFLLQKRVTHGLLAEDLYSESISWFIFFAKLIRSDEYQMSWEVQKLHEESEEGRQGWILHEMPIWTGYGDDDSRDGHGDHAQPVGQPEAGTVAWVFLTGILTNTFLGWRYCSFIILCKIALFWTAT